MARPTKNNPAGAQKSPKRTPEALQKLEQAFSMGCSDPEASFYAGISTTTYYEWMKSDPKLAERLKALKNKPVLLARQKIVESIMEDVNTAKWYLERKRRDEFAIKIEQDNTSSDGSMTPIRADDIADAIQQVIDENDV